MIINIPTKAKAILQDNKTKYSGNIWGSFNINFSYGDIRLAPRGLMATNADGIGIPSDFLVTDGNALLIAVTNDYAMSTDTGTPGSGWTKFHTGAAGSEIYPTTDYSSSIIAFNDNIYISSGNDINEYDGTTIDIDWWTSALGASALSGSVAHPLCVGFNNLMLVGDGSNIHAVDVYDNVFEDIVKLPKIYEILWIISSANMIWIGTMMNDGNSYKASVFAWDGASDNFNSQYVVDAGATCAGALLGDVLHIVTDKGAILKFNGSGFTKVANFPNYGRNYLISNTDAYYQAAIHRNGMTTIGENLYIYIDSEPATFEGVKEKEEFPAGIWKYNKDTGLTHFASNCISEDSDLTDYGQKYIVEATALRGMYVNTGYSQETLMFGGDDQLNYTDFQESGRSRYYASGGSIITPRIEAEEIEETFEKIFIKSDNPEDGTIKIKYRTEEKYNSATVTGHWTSTTTFTTTSSLDIGDEVCILDGYGGGKTSYVKTITGTYTITLEDVITGVTSGEDFYFRPNNFKLLGTITEDSPNINEFSIMKDAEWIQIKAELVSGGQSVAPGGGTPVIREMSLKTNIKTQYKQ